MCCFCASLFNRVWRNAGFGAASNGAGTARAYQLGEQEGVVSSLLLSGAAQAIEGSIDVGEHNTNLNIGLGTTSPGLFLKGNWLRSDHDGSTYGLGLGYNVDIGRLLMAPTAKTISPIRKMAKMASPWRWAAARSTASTACGACTAILLRAGRSDRPS
nr:antiholin-like protein LrgB [Candidatus Pantoea persica]